MPENKLGQSRRSHCIGNFGPGSIVEFRAPSNGAAISCVVGGLEEWDRWATPAGLANPQVTYEKRLQKYLNVAGFRLPPIDPDAEALHKPRNYIPKYLAAARFPLWLQCPSCHVIAPAPRWQSGPPGDPTLRCADCSDPDNEKYVYVVPARFVVACRHGHLQEFPWDAWVHHDHACNNKESGRLRLYQSSKAGLAGLILECPVCQQSRPMEGAFGKDMMSKLGVTCAGWRPWLEERPRTEEEFLCREVPRAMQRGASNIYFPVVASALAIPPLTEDIHIRLNEHWASFVSTPPEEWPLVIRYREIDKELNMQPDEIIRQVKEAMDSFEATDIPTIRWEEYRKFCAPLVGEHVDFDLRPEEVPPALQDFFDLIVRVVRLREVRALRGFTRIKPPSGEMEHDSPTLAPLSLAESRLNWLPAVEVRGEGIFLRLKEEALLAWQQRNPSVIARAAQINSAFAAAWHERHESSPPRQITPRFLLIHTLSHALMRQLTLSCGYSSASLRERLFADDRRQMAGLLIYTATPDSDGSLGGLERQGRTTRMSEIIPAALRDIEWCSNDPLCINDISTFSDEQNLAACHACVMAPETSCEEFNVLLDRAMLVGTPADKSMGFFAPLLDPLAEL